MTEPPITSLETRLNDFDPRVRAAALSELCAAAHGKAIGPQPETDLVNMHCHSFFSFNAYGHSPTSLSWLGRQTGLRAMGIVDFDVLDGVDEFLDACDVVGLRGSAGIETRVFIPDYADQEINSPGEPGVCYHMGIGLTRSIPPDSVAPILEDLGRRAGERNREMVSRINEALHPVAIDYRRDVLPLTPAGHPSERHVVVAYLRAAERTVADAAAFWAGRLGVERAEVAALMPDAPALQNLIRARLMKRGGPGYIEPASQWYASLWAFHELIVACGGLPCAAWLNGTSPVEQRIEDWLGFLIGEGVMALNIIPDRNWNIADPQVRLDRVRALYRVVELAQELALPLNIGTEMNSYGQRVVDDLASAELLPVRQAFLDGAFFVYGHTVLERAAGMGGQSEWARTALPDRRQRNAFYTQAGHLVPPGKESGQWLGALSPSMSPDEVTAALRQPAAGRNRA
jgi:hypothetical protein